MKTVALILARGGSKGIPSKNLQPINGLSLLEWSVNATKYANIDEVWVSTDSSHIKSHAKTLGAKVIDRPDSISHDRSPSEDALLHFAENVDFDTLVFVQPTSPLLKPVHINEGLEKMKRYDSVFSVYREHWLPRWSLGVEPINFSNNQRPRRQDKTDVYVENGAFYITTKELLRKNKTRVSGKIGVVEMSFYESFQVDTFDDLNNIGKLL
jgi:CMP-N,N'-diacetyllegionaminic acid synthase